MLAKWPHTIALYRMAADKPQPAERIGGYGYGYRKPIFSKMWWGWHFLPGLSRGADVFGRRDAEVAEAGGMRRWRNRGGTETFRAAASWCERNEREEGRAENGGEGRERRRGAAERGDEQERRAGNGQWRQQWLCDGRWAGGRSCCLLTVRRSARAKLSIVESGSASAGEQRSVVSGRGARGALAGGG